MEKLQVLATFEGVNKNYTDVELSSGKIIKNVPFFDREGHEITYDEALELYGFDGLSQDIWDDEEYLNHLNNFASLQLAKELWNLDKMITTKQYSYAPKDRTLFVYVSTGTHQYLDLDFNYLAKFLAQHGLH